MLLHFLEILQSIYSTSAGDGDFRISISLLEKTEPMSSKFPMIDSTFFKQ